MSPAPLELRTGDARAEVDDFGRARARVFEVIGEAATRAGRAADDVTLVAVSKTVPAQRLRAAIAAGLTTLGENRVQEAASKAAELEGVDWHLVGPLQSNKARRALETFAVIQSVDSVELARRLDTIAASMDRPRVPVLLQVNVDRDAGKAGFDPDAIVAAAETLDGLARIEVRGLMTIGRLAAMPEEARPTFAALRELAARLRSAWPGLGPDLSMGMSDDYAVAVEEGATIVRVGRALFGARPLP